eukprot:TRINITY_DN51265_c0_g1_i1.p1 TRINITY_DN51265_c0_g1~~TRINITY_DN51265_c0_g1_i1.p1  ORF type:complete len:307 (+),score=97.22 TRINITY_DN51265_c0_g1_i1:86-922(+)
MEASSMRWMADVLNPKIPEFSLPMDERPLGQGSQMLMMSALYLTSLTAVKIAAARVPMGKLANTLSLVNNVVMCLYSAYTFVGCTLTLLANWQEMGYDTWAPFCDPERRMLRGMDFWFYHFYLSKFWEWIDTWILIMKGKKVWPPSNPQFFLHVFHHTTTASIAWLAWRQHFSIAWMGPLTNAFVHTPMYGYYFLTDFWVGVRKYGIFITPIQIIQFILCLAALVPETAYTKQCRAHRPTIGWMWFTYSVFLCLFVKMFMDKKRARRGSRSVDTKKAE